MNAISKPHLVDLLRHFDRQKWVCPRIRYASVRSKPELITDILRVFRVIRVKKIIHFLPHRSLHRLPKIEYDLEQRRYRFDGVPMNVPRISREKVQFEIRRGPYVVHFGFDEIPPQISK